MGLAQSLGDRNTYEGWRNHTLARRMHRGLPLCLWIHRYQMCELSATRPQWRPQMSDEVQ
jgi:hypothetical protein